MYQMNEILSCHSDEEVLVNAVMDTLQNLAATEDADLIKDLGRLHPYLASGSAQNNAKGLMQAIRANQSIETYI